MDSRIDHSLLGVFSCHDVHRSSDEEGVDAAGDGLVEAAFFAEVGTDDLQRAERLQLLEVRVLCYTIWDARTNKAGASVFRQ